MPRFTLTANCEIVTEIDAETLEEAIDIAYETPVGYWQFTSDYPEFVEEMGLPTMKELEDKEKDSEDDPDEPGNTGSESSILS